MRTAGKLMPFMDADMQEIQQLSTRINNIYLNLALKETSERNRELEENAIRLTEACEANKLLVQEYREKNDTLTGLLGEYKVLKAKAENLSRGVDKAKAASCKC